jgi:hypothetical protein
MKLRVVADLDTREKDMGLEGSGVDLLDALADLQFGRSTDVPVGRFRHQRVLILGNAVLGETVDGDHIRATDRCVARDLVEDRLGGVRDDLEPQLSDSSARTAVADRVRTDLNQPLRERLEER